VTLGPRHTGAPGALPHTGAGRRRRVAPQRPERRGCRTSQAGFSLIEVMVASVILLSVLVSVSSLLGTVFKVGANSRFKQEATLIATSTLDAQIATGASTLLGETGTRSLPSVTAAGHVYLLEMEVAPFDPANSQCVSPASDPGAMLKVTIWATWQTQPAGATWWLANSPTATGQLANVASLISVPSSIINPTKGSILVAIQGAAGAGVPNVAVTATPSSGTALTVTTTAGGCALFANLTATSGGSPTWTVSFGSLFGYMTEQELTTLPTQSALSVTADTTTSLYFEPTVTPYNAYDAAATVMPVYTVPMANGIHPALPANITSLPLSFYSTALQVSPYLSASPANVFPMPTSPSYTVVTGTCGAESAPDGVAVDGQPVTVSAGGTASPSFTLVPVQIFVSYGGAPVSAASLGASVSNAAGTGPDANCPTTGSGVMPTLQLASTTATWTSFHRGRAPPPGSDRRRAAPAGPHPAILLDTCSSNCATRTTTTSSLNPSTAGASVTLTATVTCSPTGCAASPGTPSAGTVQFKDNGVALGSAVTVSASGVATLAISTLAVGTHPITAVYSGSGTKWAGSTSSSLSQVVNAAPTTTALTAAPNPNSYGTSAILTATVTCSASGCATPTGTVTFTNGGVNIAGCIAVTVNSGVATCTLSGLSGGSYSVAAVYTPTTNYKTSTSPTVTQVVVAASTTTVLTSSANPSTFNTSVTLTATVTPASGAPAVGSVAFMDGAATLGTATLNGAGVATYATSTLSLGAHALSAVFTPTNTNNFGPSTGVLAQVVNAAAGSAYSMCGLPYGVWLLSATYVVGPNTYRSSNEPTQVVVTITPAGVSVATAGTFGPVLPAGSPVTVYVK